jgi:hypothetical protein
MFVKIFCPPTINQNRAEEKGSAPNAPMQETPEMIDKFRPKEKHTVAIGLATYEDDVLLRRPLGAKLLVEYVKVSFDALHSLFELVDAFIQCIRLKVQPAGDGQTQADDDGGDLQCGLTTGRGRKLVELLHVAAQFSNLFALIVDFLTDFSNFRVKHRAQDKLLSRSSG